MRIELNIAPVSKSRPRFDTYTGRTYTDSKTREFEETIGYLYKLIGIAYKDDRTICEVVSSKHFGLEDKIIIEIEEV